MSGGNHIRAVGASGDDKAAEAPVEGEEIALPEPSSDDWDADWEDEPASRSFSWIWPSLAILAVLGWTGFFGWANQAAIVASAAPQQWIEWIVQWAVPVLLVVAVWLLAQRNGTREANRFAEAASALSAESQQLEDRLTKVNRELSLAREFLSTQGLELESLGRITSERLSEHAETLQSLVRNNSAQVEEIATVSTTAMENMDKLRDDLPVIANSARDVANQIGNAGGTAEGQIERLVSGFERLNEFGSASERQVTALGEQVDATLAAFEAQAAKMEDITAARFSALREKSDEFRGELDSREVESLASLRRRADQLTEELGTTRGALEEQEEEALKSMRARLSGLRTESDTIARAIREGEDEAKTLWGDQITALKDRLLEAIKQIQIVDDKAMTNARTKLHGLQESAAAISDKIEERSSQFQTDIAGRRSEIEEAEQQAIAALHTQLTQIDEELTARRAQQAEQAQALHDSTAEVSTEVSQLVEQIEAVSAQAQETQRGMLDTTTSMAGNLATSREDMLATQSVVEEMTEACVRLLELIQASAQHSKEELPAAISIAEERLTQARESSEALGALLSESVTRSESISNYVIAANDGGSALDTRTGELEARLHNLSEAYTAEVSTLRTALEELEQDGRRVSETSSVALTAAIDTLENKVREALTLAGDESNQAMDRIADGIGTRAAGAIDRAVREQSDTAIADLDQAATRSAGAAREAAVQLRDQLALVNELTGNLETRVERAREQAEEQVDNDFARRVALITEALNSNAIDIAKSLSTDVTDTAWASYLRGDRGIFTRRAVSILSSTEAREIAELYDADMDFRDHVSRYIHDFESMLRTMLSTRDGNAIGVTLLSSDMGKLYVAMAQAIERLRTE